jgi:hypothetical protein
MPSMTTARSSVEINRDRGTRFIIMTFANQ